MPANNYYYASISVINFLYVTFMIFFHTVQKTIVLFRAAYFRNVQSRVKRTGGNQPEPTVSSLLSVEDEQSSSEHLALFFTLSLSQLPAILYLPTYPELAFMN